MTIGSACVCACACVSSSQQLPLFVCVILLYSIGKSLWELFIEQFDDLLVKILLAAATISFVSSLVAIIYL